MVRPRKRVRSRDGVAAARDLRVPSLSGDAEQLGGQLVGERVLRRPEAALDTLPGPASGGRPQGVLRRRRGGGDLRGSEGARPPASLRRETREVWPRGVCWLSGLSGVRQARGRRVRHPLSAAVNTVAAHPREPSGTAVQRAS